MRLVHGTRDVRKGRPVRESLTRAFEYRLDRDVILKVSDVVTSIFLNNPGCLFQL